jgi:hypothetical protein
VTIFLKIFLRCYTLSNWANNFIQVGPPNTLRCGYHLHSGQKCLPRVACLWSKMPMFQRAGMREGGEPLPLAFQYLILMIWRPCDLDLVMISSLAAKCQDFEIGGVQFHIIKWLKNRHFNFKVLAFWNQQRYHPQIQITMSSYHKNQILKC